jgi:hypothetical protein
MQLILLMKLNKAMIYFSQTGAPRAMQATFKAMLPVTAWAKLDSTPYGRNVASDGSVVLKDVNELLAELQRSHVHMDHYTFPTGKEVRFLGTNGTIGNEDT